jgi:NAD(P)-dependent dehydrogenase (short-subunit alcohol dehydrogenase family)
VARIDLATAPAASGDGESDGDLGGVDITDPEAAAQAVRTIVDRFGGVDVLVNVAGGFTWTPLQDGGGGAFARMFQMNVQTAATMTAAALPELLKRPGARIVNIGAAASLKAAAGMGAYAAAKAGVARLTEALAEELKGQDITVNAVLPLIIDTPANRADMPNADPNDWVKPASLAEVILFLASPAAGVISGALIPVTRGG